MRTTKKIEEALKECFRRLYKASTPSADFDELVENAETDENGYKVIDFMAYEIEEEKMEQIISDVIKEYKLKPQYKARTFRTSILLGASPKTKRVKK